MGGEQDQRHKRRSVQSLLQKADHRRERPQKQRLQVQVYLPEAELDWRRAAQKRYKWRESFLSPELERALAVVLRGFGGGRTGNCVFVGGKKEERKGVL